MTLDWNDLEGVSLAGRYWLKQCLSSTAKEACYLTRFGASCDAAVRVIRADAPGAFERLELWREALAMEHPHLLRMLDAGRTEAAGTDLIYAVSEYPDDLLARALAGSPLSADEAGAVLEACLSALRFLHGKSLVHGAVAADGIGAVGETIKLPCDTIRRSGAPQAGGGDEAAAATPASDMWSLGVMLAEILTRERPTLRSEVGYLPEPFATIASHTLRKDPAERWSADEVEAYIHEPAVVAPPEPPVAVAALATPPVASEVETPDARVAADSRPAVRHGHSLRWVPLVGLVAAAGLSALFLPHAKGPAASPSATPLATPPAKSAPPSPAAAPAVAQPNPPVVHDTETRSNPAAIWRVVVYEYAQRAAAERKARTLNEKRPAWHAEVFTPRGERSPYLVALGGRMTLAEAERLKMQARGAGLPRDTFVRNFSR
jgi:eukaryotic-like serine/threonine-protein kinase